MGLFPFGFMQSQSEPLLLDLYPSATAGYSVRKLRTAYTGSAIRVRRSSDNAEQDIGFSGGNLDTTSLTSFCSGTNGFVTTWYDQSGNGNNATQPTASNQPQIVSGGSVLTITGIGSARPILRFDGTNDFFDFSTITATQFTTFYPSKKSLDSDISAWFTINATTGVPYSAVIYRNNGIYIGNIARTTYSPTYNNNDYILISGYINSSNDGFAQINNSTITLTSQFVDSGSNYFDRINRRGLNEYSKCDVPEMILYTFDNSSNLSAINTNINTYYGIY